ncbi:hypothetical protein D3C81_2081770 [compost metagenome]
MRLLPGLLAAGQLPAYMVDGLRLGAGGRECRAAEPLLADRDDLLADQDAEQADQRDQWRRRRAYVEQTVDDADQQAGPS